MSEVEETCVVATKGDDDENVLDCEDERDTVVPVKKSESLDKVDNITRWLLVGMGLHTVLSPVLRNYIAPKLDQLWQTLKNNSNIDTQQYSNQLESYQSTYLNYEAINNNEVLGLRKQSQYDYTVKDSVDLSKLFLATNMAKYTSFNEKCDLSTLLRIIIRTDICPQNGRHVAEKVRSDVRNPWAHFNVTEWSHTKYIECFDLMEHFIRCLELSPQEERISISELQELKQNGQKHLAGTASVARTEIIKQMQIFIEKLEVIVFETPVKIQQLKNELTVANQKMFNHSKGMRQLEQNESEGIFHLNMTFIDEFYKDIAMDVVLVYFEIKILGIESFKMFLERNLHKIFHINKSRIPCCQCHNMSLAVNHGKDSLSDEQFLSLYEKKGQPASNHELKNGDRIEQYCLCDYVPKSNLDIDRMDIVLISKLIKTCCVSYPGNPSWLDSIIDARNKICHAMEDRHLTEEMKNVLWIQLEEAVLNPASTIGYLYSKSVKKKIEKMKVNFNKMVTKASAEYVQSTLQEVGIKIDNLDQRFTQQEIQTTDLNVPGTVGGIKPMTTHVEDNDKCYVAWKFENPANWSEHEMMEKFRCVSAITNFKLKFVYQG